MRSFGTGLSKLTLTTAIFSVAVFGQQKASISGIVHKVDGPPVSHVEVRIEGAGATLTRDSGEFTMPMTGNLKVGMPAVFHVEQWIILKPCELRNGRTYLRDPAAEPIEFFVLRPGDPRLKSAKASVSIIGCIIEEEASQFVNRRRSAGGPPAAQTTAGGKIGASAVWQPPQDFLSKAHSVCDKSAGPASFPACFMNQIAAAGAPADAVSFTRMLYQQSNGLVGIMSAFKNYGVVDAAQVFYPLRANDNYGLLLVNGEPRILDVDDLQRLDQQTMEQDPLFQSVRQKYSQTDIWPGDRSGSAPWPRVQPLPGGGTQLIVTYPLLNGCHACQHVGLARFGWGFDAKGNFLRTTYIPTPPPPSSSLSNEPSRQSKPTYFSSNSKLSGGASQSHLVQASFYPPLSQDRSEALSPRSQGSGGLGQDEFLATKAKELGFSVEELESAIDAWSKSVKDLYQKGLAALYAGRYEEATRYISDSIASSKVDVIDRQVPLARAEYEQGRYTAAESALQKVLAVHDDDPVVLNNLALALDAQAKYNEAEPLYKRALAINEKALGPNHPSVAVVLSNLGDLQRKEARYSEAELLYKRALAIDETALGPDHPFVADVLNNLAALYQAQGRFSEAEPLLERSLAIDEKALGPDHPSVAIDLNNLAILYKAQDEYNKAEALVKRALTITEKASGPDNPEVATRLNTLAALYMEQGEYNEAEPLYKRALAIDEKAFGPDHLNVATDVKNLALVYCSQRYMSNTDKCSEAEPLYKRALAIDEKALGPDHPDVAADLETLAWFYYRHHKYSEAEPLYRRVLAIKEKWGPDLPAVADVAEDLANTLRELGRDSEAEAYDEQAAKIRAKRKQ